MTPDGGYDAGYEACSCFWGTQPGSLVNRLFDICPTIRGLKVFDAGCGEGKNAMALARMGAVVDAVDISEHAIRNAKRAWPDYEIVNWASCDVAEYDLPNEWYEVVIAYGLLHCLSSHQHVATMVDKLQKATSQGGYNLICTFNDRRQELDVHPDLNPILLPHDDFVRLYDGWKLMYETDTDLQEVHPHNPVVHTHSMTRIIARKESR